MTSAKSKKILVYIIMGLLSLAGIFSEIFVCLRNTSFLVTVETIVTCLMFILIAYYAVSNFKIPHGNLLKYLFLVFAVMCFTGLIQPDTSGTSSQVPSYVYQTLREAVVIISSYIAGRLERIKQNTILMVISAFLLLATSIECIIVFKVTGFVSVLFVNNFFILWLDLMIAYRFRYHSHKEAGLTDK